MLGFTRAMLVLPAFRRCRRLPSRYGPLLALVWVAMGMGLAGCGSNDVRIGAAIAALPGEDVAGPCLFEIVVAPATVQKGVLVLYQRGDTESLYEDADLRAMAADLDYAIVWAHECDARSTGDFQPKASEGPARMLYAALTAMAHSTAHPELATANVILYGFSAAGILTATMANEYPERILGTVQYAAGSAYLDLDTVQVTAAAARVPTLILASAADAAAGTSRSFRYFQRGRAKGAAWAYGVQDGIGHCCTLSTRPVVLPWIEAVAGGAKSGVGAGTGSYFVCSPDGVTDNQGETDCQFSAASLTRVAGLSHEQSGWLPNKATATAWLAWVMQAGAD